MVQQQYYMGVLKHIGLYIITRERRTFDDNNKLINAERILMFSSWKYKMYKKNKMKTKTLNGDKTSKLNGFEFINDARKPKSFSLSVIFPALPTAGPVEKENRYVYILTQILSNSSLYTNNQFDEALMKSVNQLVCTVTAEWGKKKTICREERQKISEDDAR